MEDIILGKPEDFDLSPIQRGTMNSRRSDIELGFRRSLETLSEVLSRSCEDTTIVFDPGAYICKVGMHSSSFPDFITPTVTGAPKFNGKTGVELSFKYGLEAYKLAPMLALNFPIEGTTAIDWEEFAEFVVHSLDNLQPSNNEGAEQVDYSIYPFLFTERLGNSRKNKQKLYEIAFELLEVPKVGILCQEF